MEAFGVLLVVLDIVLVVFAFTAIALGIANYIGGSISSVAGAWFCVVFALVWVCTFIVYLNTPAELMYGALRGITNIVMWGSLVVLAFVALSLGSHSYPPRPYKEKKR